MIKFTTIKKKLGILFKKKQLKVNYAEGLSKIILSFYL